MNESLEHVFWIWSLINTPHRLHGIYYIIKQIIPALQRVFSLIDVELKLWYAEMPRLALSVLAKRHPIVSPLKGRLGTYGYDAKKYQKGPANRWTIDRYYLSQHCVVCGELIRASTFVCDHCSMNQCIVAMTITGRTTKLEKESQHLDAVCRHCGGGSCNVNNEIYNRVIFKSIELQLKRLFKNR